MPIIRHECKSGPLRHTNGGVEAIVFLNRRYKNSRLNECACVCVCVCLCVYYICI